MPAREEKRRVGQISVARAHALFQTRLKKGASDIKGGLPAKFDAKNGVALGSAPSFMRPCQLASRR